MPLTKLDTYGALIVTDLQKSIVGIPTVHPAGEIIGRAAQLARAFRERNLRVVLVNVTRIASSSGVESTARSAHYYGYNVVLVVDAMPDGDADAHRHSIEKIFPRLGQTDTTNSVLKVLHG